MRYRYTTSNKWRNCLQIENIFAWDVNYCNFNYYYIYSIKESVAVVSFCYFCSPSWLTDVLIQSHSNPINNQSQLAPVSLQEVDGAECIQAVVWNFCKPSDKVSHSYLWKSFTLMTQQLHHTLGLICRI